MTTTGNEYDQEFFAQFLDDFFAECDEHLSEMRRAVLSLERYENQVVHDQVAVDSLFRSAHTLKGLAGMGGIDEAEQLAHHLESYLRSLRDQKAVLEPAGLDMLTDGIKTLEGLFAAYRAQTGRPAEPPRAEDRPELETGTAPAQPAVEPSPGPAEGDTLPPPTQGESERLAAAARQGKRIWRCSFTPSPELARRGMNINEARRRLESVGEIIQARPTVSPDGGLRFDFVIASHQDGSAFTAWASDGLICEPLEVDGDAGGQESPSPPSAANARPTAPLTLKVVRVELDRLNEMVQLLGGLVISRARLEEDIKQLQAHGAPRAQLRDLIETHSVMGRQLRDLREAMMRLRLVRIGEAFERMRFVVRDLARDAAKRVTVEISGQETDIDKFVVERMMDPLLHLVRNAVAHGLEPVEERLARGKSPDGKLSLRAYMAGEMVVIEIEDDGRGLDTEAIAARGRALGLLDERTAPDEAKLLEVICAPGFSTRDEADRGSGRGMGMSIVRNTVQELGGALYVRTTPGAGTCFTVRLPLTLAIIDALIVRAGGQTFAVPRQAVHEVIELDAAAVTNVGGGELIAHRGAAIPLLRLANCFGLPPGEGRFALILGNGQSMAGAVVEHIAGLREIVVQPITDPLVKTVGVSGATELGDGRPILILDTGSLIEQMRSAGAEPD